MPNPSSTSPKSERPQKAKSAAQQASDVNREQQLAVRGNLPRPNDRTAPGERDNLRFKR